MKSVSHFAVASHLLTALAGTLLVPAPTVAHEPPPPPAIVPLELPKSTPTAPPDTSQRRRPFVPPDPRIEAAILAEDAKIPRPKVPTGPQARLSLFGSTQALGRSFVFVIDHSKSMGGEGLGAIHAASKELANRIDELSDQQTFQVVAYNQSVDWFTGQELIPATAANKRKLVAFIDNLIAYGQTEHRRGLLAALRLKPEVIFLLTDGGDPPLDPGQLKLIREAAAGGTTIHCVHFGRGPASDRGSFLVRLARDNGGSYVYVDMKGR